MGSEIAYLDARQEEPLYVDLDDSVGGSMTAEITKFKTETLDSAPGGIPAQFDLEMMETSVNRTTDDSGVTNRTEASRM